MVSSLIVIAFLPDGRIGCVHCLYSTVRQRLISLLPGGRVDAGADVPGCILVVTLGSEAIHAGVSDNPRKIGECKSAAEQESNEGGRCSR